MTPHRPAKSQVILRPACTGAGTGAPAPAALGAVLHRHRRLQAVNDQYWPPRRRRGLLKAIALRMNRAAAQVRHGGAAGRRRVRGDRGTSRPDAKNARWRLGATARRAAARTVPAGSAGRHRRHRQPRTSAPASASPMFPEHARDVDGLISAADEVMYKAKRHGQEPVPAGGQARLVATAARAVRCPGTGGYAVAGFLPW